LIIIGFFFPFAFIFGIRDVGGKLLVTAFSWYWGLVAKAENDVTSIYINIGIFPFIVGLIAIVSAISLFYLGYRAKKEEKITDAIYWIIIGLTLTFLPILEIVYELFGPGDGALGGIMPFNMPFMTIPISSVLFLITGIFVFSKGYKAR
jgi:hypothetical protein